MAAYTRSPQRFLDLGLSLAPRDVVAANRAPYLLNIRQRVDGAIEPRRGMKLVTPPPAAPGVMHTLTRLNDVTPFTLVPALNFAGVGVSLYGTTPGGAYGAAVDTGYSGDPLSIVFATPVQSPRPFAYVGDRTRIRKVNTDKVVYPIGLAQPLAPPAVVLAQPLTTLLSEIDSAGTWVAAGGVAGATGTINRVNTTIASILYDTGNTGWASIAATSMVAINAGCRVTLAAAETVNVDQVTIAIAATTIAQIVYDVGATGLCTIQPVSSLGTGQLDDVPIGAYAARNPKGRFGLGIAVPRGQVGVPPQTPLTDPAPRIRQTDFPVNSLVVLNATETVRILSIAVNADGVQSFRCSTTGTFAAGQTITGVAAFRAYLTTTRAAGQAITDVAVENVLTPAPAPGATRAAYTGGIAAAVLAVNAAQVSTGAPARATTGEDEIHLSIRVSRLDYVAAVRLYLDVDAAANDFLHNYFVYEWRANDILAAIQAVNAAQVSTITEARTTVVTNEQIDPGPHARRRPVIPEA
jgi:hypothetical protein